MEAALSTTFNQEFDIAGRQVGGSASCYVIAEAGVNHFGKIDKAKQLVDTACAAGCDAVKLQHYSTDLLVGPTAPEWRTRLRSKELSDSAILEIRDYCVSRDITFLCTGHEERALSFLVMEAQVPAIKIGSGEIENDPFLTLAGSYGIPVILSTGMYNLDQVRHAVSILLEAGCRDLAILHCVTSYPTAPDAVNLAAMSQIREFFSGPVGYSDHTVGTAIPLAAVALGAKVLEKHITIDLDVPDAQDWKVSTTPDTLPQFIQEVRNVEAALGGWEKTPSPEEIEAMRWARKSLTFRRGLEAGDRVLREDLLCQRPGDGLPASRLDEIVGRHLVRKVTAGTVVTLDLFEN